MDDEKYIIIRQEGGFCSQITYVGLGLFFQSKGYKVKYDLEWFESRGMSNDGKVKYNYDIQTAFPGISCEIADKEEAEFYKTNYYYTFDKSVANCTPPAYIKGYPIERMLHFNQRDFFIENFNPVDKEEVEDIRQRILSSKSCGVHARRGDLALGYNPVYGCPTPVEYFLKAIKIIHGLSNDVKFYFFSDECDWVKNELIPKIDFKINYEVCEKSGPERGYLDLYLMTHCDYLISSLGCLARYAKKLSKKNPCIILDRPDPTILNYFENAIVLNDTMLANAKYRASIK